MQQQLLQLPQVHCDPIKFVFDRHIVHGCLPAYITHPAEAHALPREGAQCDPTYTPWSSVQAA